MTNVMFRVYNGEVTAILWEKGQPTFNERGLGTCYCRIGQHSECHIAWYWRTRPAIRTEYESLKKELEAIGYSLKLKTRRET
jgi:hypothetical protein